jgi:hypothetical protein
MPLHKEERGPRAPPTPDFRLPHYNLPVVNLPLRERFLTWWRHAFAVDKYDESSLEPAERELLDRLADQIGARRLGTAAILWLQSNRHMNFIGSSVLVAAEPLYDMGHQFVSPLLKRLGIYVTPEEMPVLIAAFEKRYSVEYLVQRIEEYQADAVDAGTDSGPEGTADDRIP